MQTQSRVRDYRRLDNGAGGSEEGELSCAAVVKTVCLSVLSGVAATGANGTEISQDVQEVIAAAGAACESTGGGEETRVSPKRQSCAASSDVRKYFGPLMRVLPMGAEDVGNRDPLEREDLSIEHVLCADSTLDEEESPQLREKV